MLKYCRAWTRLRLEAQVIMHLNVLRDAGSMMKAEECWKAPKFFLSTAIFVKADRGALASNTFVGMLPTFVQYQMSGRYKRSAFHCRPVYSMLTKELVQFGELDSHDLQRCRFRPVPCWTQRSEPNNIRRLLIQSIPIHTAFQRASVHNDWWNHDFWLHLVGKTHAA